MLSKNVAGHQGIIDLASGIGGHQLKYPVLNQTLFLRILTPPLPPPPYIWDLRYPKIFLAALRAARGLYTLVTSHLGGM